MIKRFWHTILITTICLIPFNATGQEYKLSPNAEISLLTCGAGNEYYLSFGHSAIRVCDTSLGIDHVYNYGTFDFDTPNLYLKFALGNLDYMLSVQNYNNFILSYRYEGRWVVEQKLNLTDEERNKLYQKRFLEPYFAPDSELPVNDFERDYWEEEQ